MLIPLRAKTFMAMSIFQFLINIVLKICLLSLCQYILCYIFNIFLEISLILVLQLVIIRLMHNVFKYVIDFPNCTFD